MKRCKTCGKLNWDGAMTCENCQETFDVKQITPLTDKEEKKSSFPEIVGGLLILVGVVFFIYEIVRLRISAHSILYITVGATVLVFRMYQEKNDMKVRYLEHEIERLKDKIERINKNDH